MRGESEVGQPTAVARCEHEQETASVRAEDARRRCKGELLPPADGQEVGLACDFQAPGAGGPDANPVAGAASGSHMEAAEQVTLRHPLDERSGGRLVVAGLV